MESKIKNGRFYSKNESLLEQVKEKERVIDEMYQEDCKSLRKHKKSWKKNASGFENVYEWMR